MTTDKKTEKMTIQRSDGDIVELSADELDQLNFERKVRDQEAAGRRITHKHVNIAALILCFIGLLYTVPRMLWLSNDEVSNYVPLSERSSTDMEEIEILPPIIREQPIYQESLDTENTEAPAASPPLEQTGVGGSSGFESSLTTTRQNIEALLPENEVINVLEQWARAWSSQNANGYLSYYAGSFISENGQNLQAWREYRTPQISAPDWIEINLTDLKVVFTETNNAQADFLQSYTASNYSEESFKRLLLVQESGEWKIHREFSINI